MGNIYIAAMIDTDFTYYFASNCLLYELDLLHCHRKLVSFEILIQKNLFVNKTQEEYIMRVRWKDSACVTPKKTIKYRKHYITAYNKDGIAGWIIDLPDDHNIYKSHYCAENAIDLALGGYGVKGKPTKKRLKFGIEIVGTY